MVAQDRTIMEEFLELVERFPDKHFAFNAQGEIVEASISFMHGWLQVHIGSLLRDHLPAGFYMVSNVAYELDGWACRPDVSISQPPDDEPIPMAPLVAVEIKSESNSLKDQREKARQYIPRGTSLVMLIFPEKRLVEVYQPAVDDQILTTADTFDGGTVLPGCQIAVNDIFPSD